MNKIKDLKNNKVLKIIFKAVKVIFFLFIIIFMMTVYLQRFSDNEFSLFSYRIFNVVTESMEPKYNIGDVLLSKEVDPSSIKVGDAISYRGRTGDVYGKIITHQVISIEQNTRGEYLFRARGLQNIIEDPTIYEDQLIGVVKYKIKTLSLLYTIISTQVGFYLCIIVPLVGVIGYEIAITLFNIEERKRSKRE